MKGKKKFVVWLTTAQTCIHSSVLLMRCILCLLAKREPHISNNNHSVMMPLPHITQKKEELLWYSIAIFQNWSFCTNKCITVLILNVILLPLMEQWSWLTLHTLEVSRMISNVLFDGKQSWTNVPALELSFCGFSICEPECSSSLARFRAVGRSTFAANKPSKKIRKLSSNYLYPSFRPYNWPTLWPALSWSDNSVMSLAHAWFTSCSPVLPTSHLGLLCW